MLASTPLPRGRGRQTKDEVSEKREGSHNSSSRPATDGTDWESIRRISKQSGEGSTEVGTGGIRNEITRVQGSGENKQNPPVTTGVHGEKLAESPKEPESWDLALYDRLNPGQ